MKRLFALFPKVWSDGCAILARRWWVGVLCAAALGSVTAWVLSVPNGPGPRTASTGVLLAASLVVWFIAFAETRRREDPAFSLTGETRSDIFWLVFLYGLAETIIAIPVYFVLLWIHRSQLAVIWFVFVDAAVRARLGYIFFAPKVDDRIGYSWAISSGPALVPSLLLGGIFTLSMWVPNNVLAHVLPRSIAQGSLPLVDFLALAFVFPWMQRWMRVAEAMHPVHEVPGPVEEATSASR